MRDSLRRLASEEGGRFSPRVLVGKKRRVRVELLDGSQLDMDIERRCRGGELLDKVCDALDLAEKDYFGLLHDEKGDQRAWVDLSKRLSKTFKNEPWDVRLAVKFYPPEPSYLQEDHTRYQLTLAVKKDLQEGRLSCSNITYALMTSYILQAELGDYGETEVDESTLMQHQVAPSALINDEFHEKVMQLYKNHNGQMPAESELNFLENAKKLYLYGADVHTAVDSEDVQITLAICAKGISIYREGTLLNRFPWTKIIKISFNKKVYTLKLRSSEFDEFETLLGFKLGSTRACKKLWKCSVEQHMFFRRAEPVTVQRVPGWWALGSRRLSCRRTLTQLRAGS